jgi:hypothetical protein
MVPDADVRSTRECLESWAHSLQPRNEVDAMARQIIAETRRRYIALADSLNEVRAAMAAILPSPGPLHWGLM